MAEMATYLILSLGLMVLFALTNKFVSWFRSVLLALKLEVSKRNTVVANNFVTDFQNNANNLVINSQRGPIVTLWFSILPLFCIYRPEHLKLILGGSKHLDKMFIYRLLANIFGKGLILSTANRWMCHRKYINPYFDLKFLEYNVSVFAKHSEVLIKKMENIELLHTEGLLKECMSGIIHELVLDLQSDDKMLEKTTYKQITFFGKERLENPLLFLDFIYSWTNDYKQELAQTYGFEYFIKEVLKRKLKHKDSSRGNSFLDSLIEISKNHPDFTEEDIVNEAVTFMLAGNETVYTCTSYVLFFLAKNKVCQDRARREVDEIFEQCNGNLKVKDLKYMKYLGACINESMRLCPNIPFFGRKLSEDLKIDDYVLPAGCTVLFSPYVTHRLPDIYENPEEYNPDRFLAKENVSPYAFYPFSAGPRNCIGKKSAILEVKVLLSMILHNFNFDLDRRTEDPLEIQYEINMFPKNGIWFKLEKISKC